MQPDVKEKNLDSINKRKVKDPVMMDNYMLIYSGVANVTKTKEVSIPDYYIWNV